MEIIRHFEAWPMQNAALVNGAWKTKSITKGGTGSQGGRGREKASCSKLLRSANSEHFLWSLHYTSKGKGKGEGKERNGECEEHAYLSNNFLTLFSGFCFVLSCCWFFLFSFLINGRAHKVTHWKLESKSSKKSSSREVATGWGKGRVECMKSAQK